ncbi:MAG TPA: DNA repair protein RecO [Bacillota bacterium]|nr:DNA repair protein RecO [Bacillota bacterium]HOR85497.1 DNA repair protein RecO [Bacillota bacterium]HPL53197.1 DNA repair protein RecO [Bacillota bacterium]
MSISKTEGIVLKYTDLGEADKILTILTRDNGKIKAIAKGCRKPRSSLLSSSEVFVFSEYVLYKGKNFYHITQAVIRETFYNIRKDLLRLSYATYFAELAEAVSDEGIPSERLFLLLAKALYYLSTEKIPMGLLSLGYQLKLMDISGYRPNLQRCGVCRKSCREYPKFSVELGGVVCEECNTDESLRNNGDIFKISQGTIEALNFLLNIEISRLNTKKIDNTIFNEIERIIRAFIQSHLDKRFKSLDFLDAIKDSGF